MTVFDAVLWLHEAENSSPHCELCGFDERNKNSSHQLPQGTIVGGQYVLGKVLGQGGFGITYIGWDRITEQTVAVKEYFPSGFAGRDTNTMAVTSYDGQDKNTFGGNKKRFLREAESLSKLWNIPQIVKVLRCFEENGTAYIAMEYVDGVDLHKYLKGKGCPMTMEETMDILGPIIEALSHVHQAELVHRDISPDNIMVLPDGSAKLLDFGAARYVENADAEKERATSTQAILKHGFAPPEQYQSHGALGPWTDVYAICATMYYCLTGKVPPEAMSRMIERKPLHWDMISGLTVRQRSALEKGMALNPKDRFASAQELWNKLGGTKKKEMPEAVVSTPKKEKPPRKEKQKKEPTLTAPVIQNKPEQKEKPAPVPKKEAPKKETKSDNAPRLMIPAIAALLAVMIGMGFFAVRKPADGNPVLQEAIPQVIESFPAEAPTEEATIPTEPALEITPLLEFEDAQLGETGTIAVLSAHDAKILLWSSDDPAVVSVSDDGNVTATGYGMAVITAQYRGQTVSCTVYVDRTPNVECSYTENETGLTITGCSERVFGEMVLPRKINGRPVTRIESRAFEYHNMESIYIPEGIEEIGYSAFLGCTSLTQLTIPKSVRVIGHDAFSGNVKLTHISIPSTVTYIERYVFHQTPWLANQKEEFVICGDGILIKYNGTESDVIIPPTVKQICNPFGDSPSGITSVTIPDSVTCIGQSAFKSCNNMVSVTIPESVTSIGDFAFNSCACLRSVTIPASVVSIGERAFWNCTDLEQIVLPESLHTIERQAFALCSKLNYVSIPNGVTTIGDSAFEACSSLTDITIPDSITTIGWCAFNKTPWLDNQEGPFVVCGDGILIEYRDVGPNVEIPSGVKNISGAFRGNPYITSVSIPGSVKFIGDVAFAGCSNLENITIPGTVISIGSSAFNGCSNLENVVIEDGVVTIDNCAFFDCYKLKNIRIPNSVTSIGTQAFWRCLELETITIPGSVESIGDSAFIHCNSLKNVILEDGVKSIGHSAFCKCALLESITIPDSVASIEDSAFEQCTRLKNIHIPNGVTTIDPSTFWGCSQLESIILPEGVTSIGKWAFYGCTNLESITIPESVASIGEQAFYSANRLEKATISQSCLVGKEAFPGRCEVSYY